MVQNGKVIAIIPTFNEENKIKKTINGLKKIPLIDNIIVVDDGSSDKTVKMVSNLKIDIIKLNRNFGKGYAIKKGIKNRKFDYLIFIDGDIGVSSREIEKLLHPVLNGKADFTIARFPRAKTKGGIGLTKGIAKYGVYLYTGKKLNSALSGQRVYSRKVIDEINFIPNRFGIEVAMTIQALRKGFIMQEIDVNMKHRETGRNIQGFIHRGKQFFNITKTLIVMFFRR